MYRFLFLFILLTSFVACKETITPENMKGKMIDFIKKEVVHTKSGETIDLKCDSLVKIYYLIRHAEKDTQRIDPSLNAKGFERAAKLNQIMKQTYLNAVYTTLTNRTIQTVDSITQYKGVSMSIYTKENLKEKFLELRNSNELNRVLITGHTNTITPIANFLSESQHFKKIIDEKEYDNLYIVTRYAKGSSKIYELKY
jgi:2,3-bisphosphoglycerate-dependent phosphoglycerate mutase